MRSSVVAMYPRSHKYYTISFPLHFAVMECRWPGWLTTRPAVAVDEYPGSQGTGISWAADVPSSMGGEAPEQFYTIS